MARLTALLFTSSDKCLYLMKGRFRRVLGSEIQLETETFRKGQSRIQGLRAADPGATPGRKDTQPPIGA
jgi:hypothetical protein